MNPPPRRHEFRPLPSPIFVAAKEIAHALGVSLRYVYVLIERGDIACIRFGDRRLIPQAELDRITRLGTEASSNKRKKAR